MNFSRFRVRFRFHGSWFRFHLLKFSWLRFRFHLPKFSWFRLRDSYLISPNFHDFHDFPFLRFKCALKLVIFILLKNALQKGLKSSSLPPLAKKGYKVSAQPRNSLVRLFWAFNWLWWSTRWPLLCKGKLVDYFCVDKKRAPQWIFQDFESDSDSTVRDSDSTF